MFVMPVHAMNVKELFNSSLSNMDFSKTHHWLKVVHIPLLPTAAATLTKLIYAGNATCGKLIVHRCIRSAVNILLSI
jgi:hypothetical protein